MKIMEKELHNILERFPQFRSRIIELFNTNSEFRSLCVDYLKCKKTLATSRDSLLKNVRLENEYKALSLDLEQEALLFFETR
jgi:uncharacterized membrane-anchored protein YhcB (DUF1043 family)